MGKKNLRGFFNLLNMHIMNHEQMTVSLFGSLFLFVCVVCKPRSVLCVLCNAVDRKKGRRLVFAMADDLLQERVND